MFKVLSTFVALTMLAFAQPAFAQPKAPDISDINIVPPAAGTDAGLAAFSGKWQGQWKNGPNTNLAVVRIDDPQHVAVVYTLGDYAAWNIKEPTKLSRLATFEGGKLKFALSIGTVTYTLEGNKLSAVFLDLTGGGKQTGTYTRSQ